MFKNFKIGDFPTNEINDYIKGIEDSQFFDYGDFPTIEINDYRALQKGVEGLFKTMAISTDESFKIKETDKVVTLRLNVPGHNSESISVSSKGNQLTIDAKKDQPDIDDVNKVYTMAEKLDWSNLTPKVLNGILTIKIPVRPESRERSYNVK